jgi:hypothetical protein
MIRMEDVTFKEYHVSPRVMLVIIHPPLRVSVKIVFLLALLVHQNPLVVHVSVLLQHPITIKQYVFKIVQIPTPQMVLRVLNVRLDVHNVPSVNVIPVPGDILK